MTSEKETLIQTTKPKKETENNSKNTSKKAKDTIRGLDYINEFKVSFPSLEPSKSSYYLTRIVLLRFIAFLYG